MSMFTKYATNRTESEVQMIDNRICIPAGGWTGLTDEELKHPDVIYAWRKDWITLDEKEPRSPKTPEKKKIKTISADDVAYSGEKTPNVKVTKLGA